MKRFIAGLIITALFPISTLAQKLTVVSATEQSWSGGIEGHYGTRYSIQLKVKGDKINIDSVYFGNKGFVPNTSVWGEQAKDSVGLTYSITAEESHYENNETPLEKGNTITAPGRTYNGGALIIYELKGKKHLFVIKEITELESIAYP